MHSRRYTWFPIAGWLLAACLFLCPAGARAAAAEDVLWNKANTFYTQKQYDSAYALYSRLLARHPDNARLQYNMGNTCYRLNKVGEAILYYEKAAHSQPGSREIRENLQLARARVQSPLPEAEPIFFVRWWNSFLLAFSSNAWAAATLLAFAAVLALVYFARVKKERFAHSGRWLSSGIVALMICGCMLYFTYDLHRDSGKAVVLIPATHLLDAPAASGKITGSLPEGTVVELYGREGDFMNVRLPNGREGWIMAAAIRKV